MYFSKKMLLSLVGWVVLSPSLYGMQQVLNVMNSGYGIPSLCIGLASARVAQLLHKKSRADLALSTEKYKSEYNYKHKEAVNDLYASSGFHIGSTLCGAFSAGCFGSYLLSWSKRGSMSLKQGVPFRILGAVSAVWLGFGFLQRSVPVACRLKEYINDVREENEEFKPKRFLTNLTDLATHVGGAALCGFGAYKCIRPLFNAQVSKGLSTFSLS